MTGFIGLLRGINVGGQKPVPMAGLRSLCADLGWRDVRSYIQSGNLVFHADAAPAELEATLEAAIHRRFGFPVTVLVRAAVDWARYVAGNPFPEASRVQPNLVMLALSRTPPGPGAVHVLRERAAGGERVALVDDALWIHYADGAGRSRLSPGLLDRLVGSPVTTRNWRTVLRLDELVAAG
jgi:uncharacterized protein (DUF1697 family)